MPYKNKLIKYIEILIISLSLIIIQLYQSNSQNYFYFINIYIDSTHLTKYGNEIVAQSYFDIISKKF